MHLLRKSFSDADYPDEENAEADEISREELRKRAETFSIEMILGWKLMDNGRVFDNQIYARHKVVDGPKVASLLAPSSSASVLEARQRYVGVIAPQTIPSPFPPASTSVGNMLIIDEPTNPNPFSLKQPIVRPTAYIPPPPLPSKSEMAKARIAAAANGPKAVTHNSTLSTARTTPSSVLTK